MYPWRVVLKTFFWLDECFGEVGKVAVPKASNNPNAQPGKSCLFGYFPYNKETNWEGAFTLLHAPVKMLIVCWNFWRCYCFTTVSFKEKKEVIALICNYVKYQYLFQRGSIYVCSNKWKSTPLLWTRILHTNMKMK